ncbi:RNA demethylase ALKBH5 [Dirofilaria immitis]
MNCVTLMAVHNYQPSRNVPTISRIVRNKIYSFGSVRIFRCGFSFKPIKSSEPIFLLTSYEAISDVMLQRVREKK